MGALDLVLCGVFLVVEYEGVVFVLCSQGVCASGQALAWLGHQARSALIFSLVCVLMIYPLLLRVEGVEGMMYVDDLIIFFPFAYSPGSLDAVFVVLREFGQFLYVA